MPVVNGFHLGSQRFLWPNSMQGITNRPQEHGCYACALRTFTTLSAPQNMPQGYALRPGQKSRKVPHIDQVIHGVNHAEDYNRIDL